MPGERSGDETLDVIMRRGGSYCGSLQAYLCNTHIQVFFYVLLNYPRTGNLLCSAAVLVNP